MSTLGPPVFCRKLSKAYGFAPALREVDFEAEAGVTVLIGHNGAGKSTLLKVLATLLRPDSGECRLLGEDLMVGSQKVRGHIGFVGHESLLDRTLTMRENLHMFASLYGVNGQSVEKQLDRMGAQPFADSLVGELSRGQEQSAALCRAMLHEPKILLLDEPANALDPNVRDRLFCVLKEEAARGVTVVLSTHDVDSARGIATQVRTMRDGKVV
jgi:ABC-type multidrug transport system ATPase subunit